MNVKGKRCGKCHREGKNSVCRRIIVWEGMGERSHQEGKELSTGGGVPGRGRNFQVGWWAAGAGKFLFPPGDAVMTKKWRSLFGLP